MIFLQHTHTSFGWHPDRFKKVRADVAFKKLILPVSFQCVVVMRVLAALNLFPRPGLGGNVFLISMDDIVE